MHQTRYFFKQEATKSVITIITSASLSSHQHQIKKNITIITSWRTTRFTSGRQWGWMRCWRRVSCENGGTILQVSEVKEVIEQKLDNFIYFAWLPKSKPSQAIHLHCNNIHHPSRD